MNMSVEEFNNLVLKNPDIRKRNPDLMKQLTGKGDQAQTEAPAEEKKKRAKYLNHKVYVYDDGHASFDNKESGHGLVKEKYDSLKEYRRYQDLLLLQKAGQISELRRQVKFVIQEKFQYRDEKIAEIAYVADHVYMRNGEQVVEDVKGVDPKNGNVITSTKDFKLKWKLLKAKYPNLKFEIF